MTADAAAHAPAGRGGTFLSLEGVDGCGKSTQARALAERLRAAGLDVVSVREPGGTAVGEKIRGILLDPANGAMCDECELLLYEASRAQLVREVVEPALARGAVVVCDRYLDSTFAYQAGGRGLSAELVRSCNALGSCGVLPDRTLVLDLPAREALGRAVGASGGADRIEAAGLAFQQRVRDAYLRLADEDPARVRVVDASGTPDEVARRVDEALAGLGLPVGEGVRRG
ncbi:MAG: dTMP kinase [Parafannyhessea sp.]|uniref:dTMP kinase n=1 Tax=Parafannyhessea sp. TaxID=2847324 RepID=UPI003F10298D